MQKFDMKNFSKYSGFLVTMIFWGISAFSIILCFIYLFFQFAYLPFFEKTILLLVPWSISCFWAGIFLWKKKGLQLSLPSLINKRTGILFIVALTITGILMAFVIDSIPSINNLSIQTSFTPNTPQQKAQLEIVNIFPIDEYGDFVEGLSLQTSISGSCQTHSYGFSCDGSSEGSVNVEAFSTSGVRIVFQGSPVGGKALLNWNGASREIETWRATYDQFELLLPYKFDFNRQTPKRKVELLVLYFSTVISLFLFLELLVNLPQWLKKVNLISNSKSRFWIFSLSMLLLAAINLAMFELYQRIDIFRLQRVRGLSLIDLDNTSHDNIQNFQVVDHFYNYYRGFDLYAVPGALEKLRLSPVTFLTFARAGSVEEIDFSPELSSRQFNLLRDKELVIIEPAGKTPFEFVFIQVGTPSSRVVCLWEYQGIYYFIPARDEINCLEGVK
ncbi:MAG: hypothetical protein AB9891_11840 [Anaerolineaceae bacterium]